MSGQKDRRTSEAEYRLTSLSLYFRLKEKFIALRHDFDTTVEDLEEKQDNNQLTRGVSIYTEPLEDYL